MKQNPKQPMMVTETPERPWSMVSTDLFHYRGGNYLVTIDYSSKWSDIVSANTITHPKSQFSKHGIPDTLISDNGTQFSSGEFINFAETMGFFTRAAAHSLHKVIDK